MSSGGGEGIVSLVIEVAVVAIEYRLLDRIRELHPTECFAELAQTIVVDRVPDEGPRSRIYLRAIQQDTYISPDVIDASLGDDLS